MASYQRDTLVLTWSCSTRNSANAPPLFISSWYIPISEILPSFRTTIWSISGRNLMLWVTKILVFCLKAPLGPMTWTNWEMSCFYGLFASYPCQNFFSLWLSYAIGTIHEKATRNSNVLVKYNDPFFGIQNIRNILPFLIKSWRMISNNEWAPSKF